MISLKGVKAVVTDIEGTTSSISFVHDVMFPYARERMEAFVRANEADIAEHLDDVRAEEGDKRMPLDEVIETLIRWIDEDRKATPLKAIQGMIWKEGFETEAFKGHIYDDAVAGLKRWHEAGKALYVYFFRIHRGAKAALWAFRSGRYHAALLRLFRYDDGREARDALLRKNR